MLTIVASVEIQVLVNWFAFSEQGAMRIFLRYSFYFTTTNKCKLFGNLDEYPSGMHLYIKGFV